MLSSVARPNFMSVTTAVYSALLFVTLVQLFSLANPIIFSTIYRITYPIEFDTDVFLSDSVDSAFALSAAGALLSRLLFKKPAAWVACTAAVGAAAFAAASYNLVQGGGWTPALQAGAVAASSAALAATYSIKRFRQEIRWSRVPLYLMIIFSAVQLLSVGQWLAYEIYPSPVYSDIERGRGIAFVILPTPDWKAPELGMKIFNLIGMASPVFILVLAFSYLFRYVLWNLKDRIARLKESRVVSFFLIQQYSQDDAGREYRGREILLILFGVALSIVLPEVAYLNAGDQLLGVDIRHYDAWLADITAGAQPGEAVFRSFIQTEGDRPLTYLVMMVLEGVTGAGRLAVLTYLPVLLGPLLVASTLVMTRIMFPSRKLEALVAAATPISIQSIVGIYAALYANWFSLIFAFLLVASIFRMWNRPTGKTFAVSVGLSLAVLLFHSYTWTYFVIALAGFMILTLATSYRSRKADALFKKLALVGLVIAAGFVVDVAKSQLLSIPLAFGANIDRASAEDNTTSAGADELDVRWSNLRYTFYVFVGGYLNLSFLFVPIILWALQARHESAANRLVLALIYVGSIPLLFTNAQLQTRILYDIPLHLPLFLYLVNLKTRYRYLIILFAFLTMLEYATRALSNFVFRPL